jgi:hypothetical protein
VVESNKNLSALLTGCGGLQYTDIAVLQSPEFQCQQHVDLPTHPGEAGGAVDEAGVSEGLHESKKKQISINDTCLLRQKKKKKKKEAEEEAKQDKYCG